MQIWAQPVLPFHPFYAEARKEVLARIMQPSCSTSVTRSPHPRGKFEKKIRYLVIQRLLS